MVIGGQAVLLYGEPRLTKDIDITLGVDIDELAQVLDGVAQLGFEILIDDPDRFVVETRVLPTRDSTSSTRIDFIFSNSTYERQAINRGKNVEIAGMPVLFAAPEDIVIHKIVAGRAVDVEDVRSIMLKNPKIDHGYIESWLLKFADALSRDFLSVFKRLEDETRE